MEEGIKKGERQEQSRSDFLATGFGISKNPRSRERFS